MAITLGTNIQSLRAQRQLTNTGDKLGSVFERLSSGQRINKASDDAAGLAIADSLNARSRVYTQGVRNLSDGVSLFNIADSGLENLTNIVIRLEELAEQAANGVYGAAQRNAIDIEAQELSEEFFRISKSTSFNGQNLFTGEFDQLNLQAGIGDDAVLQANVGGAIGAGDFNDANTIALNGLIRADGLDLGDLNGDGFLDLVTTGRRGAPFFNGGLTVQLGDGTGSFASSATSYAGEASSSYAVKLGDLNGDGILDLVTAGTDGIDGTALVRLGDGVGSFGEAVSFATEGSASYDLSLVDLNSDGHLDLVTAGYEGGSGGAVTIRLGDGRGSFGDATSFATEFLNSRGLEIGDLNNDGHLDLVTAGDGGTEGFATVRLGDGTGSFGAATSFATESQNSNDVSLADLNNDGNLDLISTGQDSIAQGETTVRLGDGTGSFGSATSYTEGTSSQALELADINGDGNIDLVTSGQNTGGVAMVRLGDGTGSFENAKEYAQESLGSYALGLGDLNGDGVLDLVTSGSIGATATVRLSDTTYGVSPLLDFSLATMAGARQALPMFKQKREQLTEQRGEIGSFQSRIQVASNVLSVSNENFIAAESRIRDVDVANESSNLVRMNILQQAAASVLAQANQQPVLALQLLG